MESERELQPWEAEEIELNKKIAQRVRERTGLSNNDEVDYYILFSSWRDNETKTINQIEVKQFIFFDLATKLSPFEQEEELKFIQLREDPFRDPNAPVPESRLVRKTRETYDRYLSLFVERGLIASKERPILRGYDPYEDSEFFEKELCLGETCYNPIFS